MVLSLAACGSGTTTTSTATEATAAEDTAAEETTGEVKQFRVGMECAFAPSNWQEDTASDTNWPIENVPGAYADGYDVQIAKHIADSLGYELVIVKLAWSGLIEALNQGQIDAIIAGMADTEERRQSINFSTPYKTTEYAIMTLSDSEYADRTSIHDFAGASVLGQKDTKLDTVIDQMEGVTHLTPVDNVPNMLSRLDQGTCDALVVNLEFTPGYLALNPDYNVITFDEGEGFDLGFNGSCVGLRLEDTDLLDAVNASLAELSQEDLDTMWAWATENQPT
jgi:ABC-type amino acid transport substrate-binding protein